MGLTNIRVVKHREFRDTKALPLTLTRAQAWLTLIPLGDLEVSIYMYRSDDLDGILQTS